MMNYKGLQALYTVLQTQSFEQAAHTLCITQSAVSQRIKRLEQETGEALLIRSLPYEATPLGQQLLAHFQQVLLLESNFQKQRQEEQTTISIALNRDSLDTWFTQVFYHANPMQQLQLEIITDDQEHTLAYFQRGMVSACLSTQAEPLPDCQVQALGHMIYALVATPTFKEKYFKTQPHEQSLLNAPAVIFDHKDRAHDWFLQHYYAVSQPYRHAHYVPSVKAFKQIIIAGRAYGLVPLIDMQDELKQKQIVLVDKHEYAIPLYWHYRPLTSTIYQQFNQCVIDSARQQLTSFYKPV